VTDAARRCIDLESAIREVLERRVAAASSIFVVPVNIRSYGCVILGCDRPATARRLCNGHYLRKLAGKPLAPPLRARKRNDLCASCEKPTGGKGGWGLCAPHYKRERFTIIKAALVDAMGGRCERCALSFPQAVFDFHHIGGKDAPIGYLIANASVEQIASEAAKCRLLCANCHRMEHWA